MEEASSAHVDPSALSASEQVREYLRTNGLEETAQNIQLAQTDLLKKSKSNPLFTSQFEVDANYPKLSASSLVQGVNNYHKNQLLKERTDLSSFQLADIHTAASNKVTKQSYALGISDLIKDASNLDRAKILQNQILKDIKNVGLPVDVLEGDMLINHMVSSAAIDPRMMGIPGFSRSFNKTLTLDFNNGDRYFKRYKEAVLSSEAIIAYENGNTSLLNRVFDAGVAKGQLKENQRQDFIDTQLRISQDLGFIKPLSQNNEQE